MGTSRSRSYTPVTTTPERHARWRHARPCPRTVRSWTSAGIVIAPPADLRAELLKLKSRRVCCFPAASAGQEREDRPLRQKVMRPKQQRVATSSHSLSSDTSAADQALICSETAGKRALRLLGPAFCRPMPTAHARPLTAAGVRRVALSPAAAPSHAAQG
jgi:hypothetical protein